MRTLSLMMFFASFFLTACSAQKNGVSPNDAGAAAIRGKWLVMSMMNNSNLQEVASLDMYAEFEPDSDRVTGRGTCNRFFGSMKLTGNQLKIGPLAGTMMACPSMDMEQKMRGLLEQADRFSQDGERLLIQSGSKTLLLLIAYPAGNIMLDEGMAETNTPLDMYTWNFVEMNDAASTIPLNQLQAKLSFDPLNQKFQGFAGCNRFFGTMTSAAQFNSGSIGLGKVGSTRMACPEMALEGKILAGLQLITRYEIRNKSLLLFDQNKQVFLLKAGPKQD
jgi:heat shock protein HslJ